MCVSLVVRKTHPAAAPLVEVNLTASRIDHGTRPGMVRNEAV
jgi:hypothetical protein